MTALVVAVVFVAIAVLVGVWMWLRYLNADRRDHRDYLVKMAALGGPENTRAAGEAFTSVGPAPTVRVRSSHAEIALGSDPSVSDPAGPVIANPASDSAVQPRPAVRPPR